MNAPAHVNVPTKEVVNNDAPLINGNMDDLLVQKINNFKRKRLQSLIIQ